MPIGTLSNSESGSSCRSKINQGLSLWDGMIGAIIAFGGPNPPSKWLICDGSAISRSTYVDLYWIIGAGYGVGDGMTTFNLPDLRGRVPAGVDGANFFALGTQIGSQTHALGTNEIPSHSHTVTVGSVETGTTAEPGGGVEPLISQNTGDTGETGGGEPHNNIQPSLCVNYIIYTGV